MESGKALCILKMMITEVKLLGGSQHHNHDILYIDKSNVKYRNTKNFLKAQKTSTELS